MQEQQFNDRTDIGGRKSFTQRFHDFILHLEGKGSDLTMEPKQVKLRLCQFKQTQQTLSVE